MRCLHQSVCDLREVRTESRRLLRKALSICFCTSIVLGASDASATEAGTDSIGTTTLEWPPYTSAELPKGGATTEVIRQAFKEAGLAFDFEVLPWKRAISEVRDNQHAIAYYPGYHCEHLGDYLASEPVGTGPLGFAEHIDAPLNWKSVSDISAQNLSIGTVQGYANTVEFDEQAANGTIRAIPARNDLTNLRKLVHKRIDAAVIDKLVLAHLLATEPSLKEVSTKIRFNPIPLEEKNLYLCFYPDEKGKERRDQFNAGLQKIDIEATVERYFAEEF